MFTAVIISTCISVSKYGTDSDYVSLISIVYTNLNYLLIHLKHMLLIYCQFYFLKVHKHS